MNLERNLSAVPPVQFTANGTQFGVVTVTSTANFYVKSIVCIQAPSIPPVRFEIKRIVSDTVMLVGPPGRINDYSADLRAFTVAAGSFAFADEQPKAAIAMETRLYASYIQEPINAWRTQNVDYQGNPYSAENPMPVAFDGTISIGSVEVKGSTGNILEPNSDGSLNVVIKDSASSTTINRYQEVTGVIYGANETIITYTAPTGANTFLQKAVVSGENVALFQVQVNGNPVETRRTYWGNLNSEFNFMIDSSAGGYTLNPGDIVTVTVLNNSPSQGTAAFESRLQLISVPI